MTSGDPMTVSAVRGAAPRTVTRRPRQSPAGRRRGVAFPYVIVGMCVFIGFTSLAVDVGRVEVAKTQLQTAADAAARAGALALQNTLYGQSAAAPTAAAAAARNYCDGTTVILDQANDVEIGYWTFATRTFVDCDVTLANAVRVTARRVAARGSGVPLLFMQILGVRSCDVIAQATVVLVPGQSVTPTISAKCNPFLAGQPPGVSASNNNPHNSPDWSAGTPGKTNSSPVQAAIPLTPGQSMTFDGVNGNATYDPSVPYVSADGGTWIANNTAGDEHGIANMTAPLNSIVAVFLSDSVPGSSPAPADLDFSTAASRDFTSLSPQLNQIFFIGDGRTSSGAVQQFVIPKGATRLFLADWDAYEWNNNVGSYTLTVHLPGHVTLVR